MDVFNKDYLEQKFNEFVIEARENELSENTIKKYHNNIIPFINFIIGKTIEKSKIVDFRDKLQNDYNFAPSTVNNYVIYINKFLKFIGLENLCIKLVRVQREDAAEDFINYTDYHRLLRLSIRKNAIKIYLIMRIFAETGIRINELKYFLVEKLDLVIQVKNKGKIRNIILTRNLLAELRKYAKKIGLTSGPLFPGKNKNKTMHDSSIRKALKDVAGWAKVSLIKVYPHSFRKYFAVQYLTSYPDDIAGLAELLGHSSLETTRIYVKLSNKQKEIKLRKVKF